MNTGRYCNKKIIFILLISAFSAAFAVLTAETYVLGGKGGWNDVDSLNGVTTGQGRFGYKCLELASNSSGKTTDTDLLLDFEGGTFTDKAGNYKIIENNLYPSKRTVRGKTAGLSRRQGDGIKLMGNNTSFLGRSGPAG